MIKTEYRYPVLTPADEAWVITVTGDLVKVESTLDGSVYIMSDEDEAVDAVESGLIGTDEWEDSHVG